MLLCSWNFSGKNTTMDCHFLLQGIFSTQELNPGPSNCRQTLYHLGSVPGLGRSPGEGKGYPLQYSGLENSRDYTVHGVAKNRTPLSDFHFTNVIIYRQYLCQILSLYSEIFNERLDLFTSCIFKIIEKPGH